MSHLEDLDTASVPENPAESHSREQYKREAISSLFELVDTLPNRQRELVLLKFQQDFRYQEISEVTELSVSNVGYILHQAIRSLKQQWESLETIPTGGTKEEYDFEIPDVDQCDCGMPGAGTCWSNFVQDIGQIQKYISFGSLAFN